MHAAIFVETWHGTAVTLAGASRVFVLERVSRGEALHTMEFGIDGNGSSS